MLLKFEMAEKFDIFEAICHILLPVGNESDFENGGEEQAEVLQLTENHLDPNYLISILIWIYWLFQPKQ